MGQSRICPRYESFDGAQDRASVVSFPAPTPGWVLPAGGEVIVTTDLSTTVFGGLRGFTQISSHKRLEGTKKNS
jgi:hypothetical protein